MSPPGIPVVWVLRTSIPSLQKTKKMLKSEFFCDWRDTPSILQCLNVSIERRKIWHKECRSCCGTCWPCKGMISLPESKQSVIFLPIYALCKSRVNKKTCLNIQSRYKLNCVTTTITKNYLTLLKLSRRTERFIFVKNMDQLIWCLVFCSLLVSSGGQITNGSDESEIDYDR